MTRTTFIIWLTDVSRYAGPSVVFNGFNGGYDFLWNEEHKKHIYGGKELTAEEFNKVAPDIFMADSGANTANYFHAVPEAVVRELMVDGTVPPLADGRPKAPKARAAVKQPEPQEAVTI